MSSGIEEEERSKYHRMPSLPCAERSPALMALEETFAIAEISETRSVLTSLTSLWVKKEISC